MRNAGRRGSRRSNIRRRSETQWGAHRPDLRRRQFRIEYHHETDDRWDMPRVDYVKARSKTEARAAFWRHHRGAYTVETVTPDNMRLRKGGALE